jgi:hypothetical protein
VAVVKRTRAVAEDEPDWGPLVQVVGEDLAGWFMWMFAPRTRGGRVLQAYKHIGSRCYLHLDAAGGAYQYMSSGRYRRIDLADALELVFEPWWSSGEAPLEDVVAAWAAIERASAGARR